LRHIHKVLEVLAEIGVDTPGELVSLDPALRTELDGELKLAGVCLGDRSKIKHLMLQ